MKKVVMFLLGLLSGLAGLIMLAAGPYTLATKSVNLKIIDSGTDKFFFLLMIVGCGLCYGMASVCLLKNWKLDEHKPVLAIGTISMFAFLAGLYYHMMFGSPW